MEHAKKRQRRTAVQTTGNEAGETAAAASSARRGQSAGGEPAGEETHPKLKPGEKKKMNKKSELGSPRHPGEEREVSRVDPRVRDGGW